MAMSFFTSVRPFRLNSPDMPPQEFGPLDYSLQIATKPPPHSSHPDFLHLILLVFEAVLEVVCVSLPGYIVARQGMFNAEMQKFAANLNVMLFTPCLIFNKLASQLSADKLADLAIIPFIFATQMMVSWLSAVGISWAFGFSKRPRNFVIAMGVFGNSNSLPISLVLSLSHTISGLHWDKVPGDNDKEVGARGILYLLIFQQLGQLVRWSWGYNVLLAPADEVAGEDDNTRSRLERGQYQERGLGEDQALLDDASVHDDQEPQGESMDIERQLEDNGELINGCAVGSTTESGYASGDRTPSTHKAYNASRSSTLSSPIIAPLARQNLATPANGNVKPANQNGHISEPSHLKSRDSSFEEEDAHGLRRPVVQLILTIKRFFIHLSNHILMAFNGAFQALPGPVRFRLTRIGCGLGKFFAGVWEFMNPPLWAMLVAIIVASVPPLQRIFFTPGTFIENSVTSAIRQSGGVAVPLILVVLGANLARNTVPVDPKHTKDDDKEETRILIASLLSRLVLPTIIMAPILALSAKYVPVSILDDPIFIIVCFLLTGAPSALQLAQICQLNNVYVGAMTRLLFQSYVIWILPSTLILVMCALEVVEWASDLY